MPPPTESHPLLRLVDVHRHFRMGEIDVPVLKGISFEIDAGERVAVVGPSGSGKTTVLNLMGGMDQPTSGEVWYCDQRLSSMTSQQLTQYRRGHVGFIFQLYNLIPTLTAEENIAVATDIATAKAMTPVEALKQVGLEDRAGHFPSQLSGGEQQRVAIARAIAKHPDLLLCDEPTGALDFETGRQIIQLLVDLNERLNTTVVIITHNGALAHVAHRTIQLRSGQVVNMETNASPQAPAELQW